jgi:hypothetical protein
MRVRDFSSDQIGVVRLVAGLRGAEPAKRPTTWVSLVRRGVLERTKAPNGTPIHAFTEEGMRLVRELQAIDSGSNPGGAS